MDAAELFIHGDPAFGVELAQGDMQCPLVVGEMPQAVGGEVQKLANAHSGPTQQKQSIGEQIVVGSELLLQTLIVLWRERLRKVVIETWKVFSADQAFLDSMFAAVRQVVEQAPEAQQVQQASSFAEWWILFAQIAEPAQYVGIAA
jgi:hypothetical protein